MVRIRLAKENNLNPYIFAGTKNDGSDTLSVYRRKSLGFDKQRDMVLSHRRIETARKFAAHFNLTFTDESKAGIIALVCRIAEIAYGTDYLAKTRHKAAVAGRAYITWILKTFFEFTVSEITAFFMKDHSTIVYYYQKFDNCTEFRKYPEHKLANVLRNVLL